MKTNVLLQGKQYLMFKVTKNLEEICLVLINISLSNVSQKMIYLERWCSQISQAFLGYRNWFKYNRNLIHWIQWVKLLKKLRTIHCTKVYSLEQEKWERPCHWIEIVKRVYVVEVSTANRKFLVELCYALQGINFLSFLFLDWCRFFLLNDGFRN